MCDKNQGAKAQGLVSDRATTGSFRETADQALGSQQASIGGAGQLGADNDYMMQQRRLANVMLQLQALAQEGHTKNITVVRHKHTGKTLSGGMVVIKYGPYTLEELVTWAEKLARFDSYSFEFSFARLDAY